MLITHGQIWKQVVLNSASAENWMDKGNITCDCPFFLKKYVCKNSLSLTVRLNLSSVPLAAKDIIIGRKPPKVGRPLYVLKCA